MSLRSIACSWEILQCRLLLRNHILRPNQQVCHKRCCATHSVRHNPTNPLFKQVAPRGQDVCLPCVELVQLGLAAGGAARMIVPGNKAEYKHLRHVCIAHVLNIFGILTYREIFAYRLQWPATRS